ncbi:hypothetical protein [Nocardia sp. 348MFTsu5.1]|uniref:hypothetical protein n=1 Tax=Nocardia sp. 348MFTsu5.1 TaxID=1172185 RepID=UPI00035D095C|nr:hypothetical protein [Nocardia sp. 348MFTsu5.1]
MIPWSVTAHTNTHTDNGILLASATDNYTDAHHAAGEAALAALDDLAGQEPSAVPFICISIDDNPLLLAAAASDENGTVDHDGLAAVITHVRDTGTPYKPAQTSW